MALNTREFCLSFNKHAKAVGIYKRASELVTQRWWSSSATLQENKLAPSDPAYRSAATLKTNTVRVSVNTCSTSAVTHLTGVMKPQFQLCHF